MRKVDIYIGTTLRGSAKGVGKGMYIMQTPLGGGGVHERKAAVEIDGGTESRLVLYCLRDCLGSLRYACDVTVHTESTYVAAAINNGWPERWREQGWTNGKGKRVKDPGLWRDILWDMEDTGCRVAAEAGRHEFSGWMRTNLVRLYAPRDVFGEVDGEALDLGRIWLQAY